MNILMITYNPTGRGTFFRANYFARELVGLKHSVTLLTTAPARKLGVKTWHEDGVQLVEFPSLLSGPFRSGWDPLTILTRLGWLKGKRFDIVHAFETRPSVIYPALKARRNGARLVLDWCDWFGKGGSVEERPNPILRTLLRWFETYYENHFRKKASSTTVICTTLYERARALGVDASTVHIVQNGFNMPGWQPTEKTLAREKFGISASAFVIGYIGSLFPKDAQLMAEAFSQVQEQLPHARLLHLGQSNYQPDLQPEAEEKVIITGNLDEASLQIGLSACDICWLPLSDIPANWGRFPLKFSNYLSAGKPVVGTAVGDIPELVNKHKVGLTCAPSSSILANTTLKIANAPNLIKKYGLSANKLAKASDSSWQSRAEDLLLIYEEVLKNYESSR